MIKPVSILWTTIPGNSEFVIPLDSTYTLAHRFQAAIAAGSTFLAPGPCRGKWEKAVCTWSCETTGQNVQVDEQILSGNAGTSADWITQTEGGGVYTVTAAAAPTRREFTPLLADWRILVTAGGTGPTTIIFRATVHFTTDRGA